MPPGDPSNTAESKRDLASWWKNFKKGTQKRDDDRSKIQVVPAALKHATNRVLDIPEPEVTPQGIFGVPLQTSVRYANVAISLNDANGQSYIYGYVPIIVAKCGVFLKEKGETLCFVSYSFD
jgi:hypothetical protein